MFYTVSGLSGNRETAQQQVLIGMGLLAGSTVMLLTLIWGSCVVVGKCDLSENSTAIDSQDTRKFSLFGMLLIILSPVYHSYRLRACLRYDRTPKLLVYQYIWVSEIDRNEFCFKNYGVL